MARVLACCALALALAGCGRADSPLSPPESESRQEALIINGFNDNDAVVLNQQWYRVGGYYDFSFYSLITIDFDARRISPTQTPDHITVRVGPTTYITDSVSSQEEHLSLRILTARLSKPQMCAVTFILPDSDATLLLSHLRVVGWTR